MAFVKLFAPQFPHVKMRLKTLLSLSICYDGLKRSIGKVMEANLREFPTAEAGAVGTTKLVMLYWVITNIK